MKEIKAPTDWIEYEDIPAIFLAGSIEEDTAIEWQDKVVNELRDLNVLVLNPRRDDWDNSWKQDIKNKKFREQVEWELDGLDRADVIALYFDPETKSPISLLELGLHVATHNIIVYCPEGYWKKGNVDVVCNRFNVLVFEDEKLWLKMIKHTMRQMENKNED